jgi:glycosyltransferase involved in cell wall biosynthesis
VVVSSRGSLPEVAGPAAEPVDPDDVDGLTSRMRELLDRRIAAPASARGLAQAARYSWTACAAAALRAYASAMEVHARRG